MVRALLLPLAFLLAAGCGFRLEDPELEDALEWAHRFNAEHPELREEIGQQCKKEIGRSPWTRDGSLALFGCIRRQAELRGLG